MDLITKICSISGKEFTITQWDLDFYDKISPTFAGQKFQIPTPTLHPEERQRRRLSFRNERNLYRRKCDASGKDIISIYSPDKPYKIYDQKIRNSDARDPMDYGRDFDLSKTFTENFRDIIKSIPRTALNSLENEWSEYVSFAWWNKNCYLIYTADQNEDCIYWSYAMYDKTCMDFAHTNNSQLCYEVIHCNESYNCHYCINIKSCSDCQFCTDMIWCKSCFLSYNQTNANYCFQNICYSKDEYNRLLKDFLSTHNHEEIKSLRKNIVKEHHNIKLTNINCSESNWKYLIDSKNCDDCENCTQCQNIKYCSFGYNMNNSMDRDFYGDNGELWYNCVNTANNCYGNICTMNCRWSSKRLLYCDLCMYCSDCFWCIGLRNKSYCIFNKQYTKEEYEILVAKIISHMIETKERGEFFHPSLSPFGYNETVAQEHYPINKWNLESFWYHRSDYQAPTPVADKIIDGQDLPVTIDEVSDDILKTAIKCEVTGKLFRIIPQELAFYRKHHLPLPRRHPDQRHLDRLALRK